MSLATGDLIAHYQLADRLGGGGMGEVYRAVDTRLGRQVALKFLPAARQTDPESRERLLSEARAASILRSPNIAVTYDLDEWNGSMFIVMEYVEGQLLSRRIAESPLGVRDAIEIALQVADALDEAHTQGIVHRDIKSQNLMITARGLVKVLDFGLAKFLNSEIDAAVTQIQQTAVGLVLGTLSYMSPEQVLGRPVDRRSDLFSLGVVIYEMLAGRLPFVGGSVTEIADQILHAEPPPLSRFVYDVPPRLETIVRKMLQKDPGYRYQTAREVFIDLRELQRLLESGALPATGSGALRATAAEAPRGANAVAVMTFSNITKEPADDWIGTGIAETVTSDLKALHGLYLVSRAQIHDVLKDLTGAEQDRFDDRLAIDAGRRLGAAWIVGGGYQRLGRQIRVTAYLVDVRTAALVKTIKLDGSIDEIFALQDKIVYELTKGLNLDLGKAEIVEIERAETQSIDAFEAFSRGLVNLRAGDRDSLDRAIYLFEKATEVDPGYASAWAALGAALDLKGGFLGLPELSEKAIRHERKAIELNPRLADAYRWLGGAYVTLGRSDEAVAALQEALKIEPNHAGAHSSLGRAYWIGQGRIPEAIEELKRATEINPDAGYAFLQLAYLYPLAGDLQRAEAAAREAISLQEQAASGREGLQVVGGHTRLGYIQYLKGDYDDAIREYEREIGFLKSSDHALGERTAIEIFQKLGAAYLRKGDAGEGVRFLELALRSFERRLAKGPVDPFTKYYVAAAYALLGDQDHALQYLEESFQELAPINRIRAARDRDFDSLRDIPRFDRLLQPSPVRR